MYSKFLRTLLSQGKLTRLRFDKYLNKVRVGACLTLLFSLATGNIAQCAQPSSDYDEKAVNTLRRTFGGDGPYNPPIEFRATWEENRQGGDCITLSTGSQIFLTASASLGTAGYTERFNQVGIQTALAHLRSPGHAPSGSRIHYAYSSGGGRTVDLYSQVLDATTMAGYLSGVTKVILTSSEAEAEAARQEELRQAVHARQLAEAEAARQRAVAQAEAAESAIVSGFYRTYLGRDAEPAGQAHWLGVLRTQGRQAVESGIVNSDEATVNGFYRAYLGRDAEPGGRAHWLGVLKAQGRQAVESGISGSAEARSDGAHARVINQFYRAYLGRDAEPSGLAHWLGVFKAKGRQAVESGISGSAEARAYVARR